MGEVQAKVECKICKSPVQRFEGELTVSLADIQRLKIAPVYVRQNVLVCLNCGFAELLVPAQELQSLKTGMAAPGS